MAAGTVEDRRRADARATCHPARVQRDRRRLAGLPAPDADQTPDDVGPPLARLLKTLEPAPACLLDLHFDFAAWNQPFDRFWHPGARPARRCNLMWLHFAEGTATADVIGRQGRGRHLLGQFHEVAAEHPGGGRRSPGSATLRSQRAGTGQLAVAGGSKHRRLPAHGSASSCRNGPAIRPSHRRVGSRLVAEACQRAARWRLGCGISTRGSVWCRIVRLSSGAPRQSTWPPAPTSRTSDDPGPAAKSHGTSTVISSTRAPRATKRSTCASPQRAPGQVRNRSGIRPKAGAATLGSGSKAGDPRR